MTQHPTTFDPNTIPAASPIGQWSGGSVIKIALSPAFAQDGIALAATLAGLFRSQDGGHTWQLSMTGLGEPTLTTVCIADGRSALDAPGPVAFVGTESGRLYRSSDLGQSWEECPSWAGLGVLTDLATAPDFGAQPYLFAATIEGAFRSLDGGNNWESCTFGLLDDEILCMATAPDFEETELVWCGTGGGGFYRSRNAAKAWREAGWGLPDSAIQALAVSPNFAVDRTLYAGLEEGGLYCSTDGGENWTIVGRATEPLPGAVNTLALLPSPDPMADTTGEAHPTILAGTNWGVFWSIDGGDHWEAAIGGDFIALDFASADDGTVIAGSLSDGLFFSPDAGKSWTQVAASPAAHAPPLIAAPTPSRLFALDHDGVLAQSLDGGASWSPPPGETAEGQIADMAIFALGAGLDKDGTAAIFAAGEAGLLSGSGPIDSPTIEWTPLAPPTAHTGATSPAPAAPLVTVSPSYDREPALLWGHYSGDLHLSVDGGQSWELTARPWGRDMTLSVTMSPDFADDRRMVAVSGKQASSGHFAMSIWQTENAGQSWTELASLETETPAMLVALPAADAESSIVLATRNRLIRIFTPSAAREIPGEIAGEMAGEMQVHQTLFEEDARVTALCISPDFSHDRTLFAGVESIVQISRDAGVTWEPLAAVPHAMAIVHLSAHASHHGFSQGSGDSRPTNLCAVTLGGAIWSIPTVAAPKSISDTTTG